MIRRFSRSIALTTLVLAASYTFPTLAQTEIGSTSQSVELAEQPLDLPGIGLEIRLPLGSTSTQQTLNREVFAEVLGEDSLWRIQIASKTSSNKKLQAEDAAKQMREDLQKAYGASQPRGVDKDENFQSFATVLDDVAPLQFSGGIAYRFFLRQPAPSPSVPDTVRGVAVIAIGEGQMLV